METFRFICPLFSYCWQHERDLCFAWKIRQSSKGRPRIVCAMCPRILKGRKSTEAWTVHNTALNSSMGIDTTTYRIRIDVSVQEVGGCWVAGGGVTFRQALLKSIHLPPLGRIFTIECLKCCVMIQQEGIMQHVYTFAGTDQWQLLEYGP